MKIRWSCLNGGEGRWAWSTKSSQLYILMAQISYSLLSDFAYPLWPNKMWGEGSNSTETSAPVFWVLKNLSKHSTLKHTLTPDPSLPWYTVRGDRLEAVPTCLGKKPPLLFRKETSPSVQKLWKNFRLNCIVFASSKPSVTDRTLGKYWT